VNDLRRWASVSVRRVLQFAAALVSLPSWQLVQATLGATVAWAIALRIAGHSDPFFAPMSAVVALNAPRGERGLQVVRLLEGVILGIVSGEIAVALLGAAYEGIALASFVAMTIAHAAGGARIVVIQAGGSAILTVAIAGGEAGVHRLIDALIGGGVALVFSQVLFSPEPVALLRRAEAEALRGIAEALHLTARALESDDGDADKALNAAREVRDRLVELARLRKASRNVARRSAIWRSQMGPLVRERENAEHLDLLGDACVMLVRAAFANELHNRREFAGAIDTLGDVLESLARTPGDRNTRQTAADRALAVARDFGQIDTPAGSRIAVTTAMLRVVAGDIMVFAGVDASEADAAIRNGRAEFQVPIPPATPRAPFGLDRWRGHRRWPRSAPELPHRTTDPTDDDPEQ
jgi:fusaric acid resistance family protein